jgi:hypothetical protein
VLPLEEDELAGLQRVQLVQAVELALVQSQDALELVEPGGGSLDVALEGIDLGRDLLDLRGEHALTLARRLDLALERVDAAVDDLLPLGGALLAGCDRGGDEQEAGPDEANQAEAEA